MNSKSKGFTLVELLLAVAIIGVLSSIAVPRMFNSIAKAREAEVKASLGAVRSAVSIYYADHEGLYPESITNGVLPGGRYLDKMPVVTIPPNSGNPGHALVTGEKILLVADDDTATGVWMYINTGGDTGSVFVNCTHLDSKGLIWTSY